MTLKLVKVDHKLVHAQEEVYETIIDIDFPSTIGGTCLKYYDSVVKKKEITWDPRAKLLYIELRGSASASFPFPGSFHIDLYIYVNDNLVVTRRWTPFSPGTKSWTTNIGAYMKNGVNTFKLEMRKPGCNAWIKALETYVAFTTDKIGIPKVRPWWWKYAVYGGIGVGTVAFIGLAVPKIIEAARKR